MSYILAGIKYWKLKRSMERHCRTYFERNACLGSRIPAHIKYYFHLLFSTTDFDWRERKFIRSWVGKSEGTRPPGTHGLRFENNIKMDLKEI
jgi:hypothetical protein